MRMVCKDVYLMDVCDKRRAEGGFDSECFLWIVLHGLVGMFILVALMQASA